MLREFLAAANEPLYEAQAASLADVRPPAAPAMAELAVA